MKTILMFFGCYFVSVNFSLCQTFDDTDIEYSRGLVKEFFDLLKEEKVTISQYEHLFGPFSLEAEESLSYQLCEDENASQIECNTEVRRKFNNPSSAESSVFKAIKEHINPILVEKLEVERNMEIYPNYQHFKISIDVMIDNNCYLYFVINKESESLICISSIAMPNGESLFFKISGRQLLLKRYGVIEDPDGYTNLRKGRGSNHPIVKKIIKDQVFYFTPTCESNWYLVQDLEDCEKGYMHKSRIRPIGTLDLSERSEVVSKQLEMSFSTGRIPCWENK